MKMGLISQKSEIGNGKRKQYNVSYQLKLMKQKHTLLNALRSTMIKDVPEYANKFIYSLGFLSMISFLMLIITGVVMTFMGANWWLTDPVGKYFRSVHLWSTQAFVLFIILHLLIVFFGSGFKKPRRLTWVIGVLMFVFVLAEAEFGYVLRGDFSSQWRSLQGADFYNGTGLGHWINNINYSQIFGIHVVVIPLTIIGLLFLHYLLVKTLGIAKPHKKDVHVETVRANHGLLFARGGVLVGVLMVLGFIFPSPFIKPDSISYVSLNDPNIIGQTVLKEFDRSSDTASYLDNIDPYTYDTRNVYVAVPYQQYISATNSTDYLSIYNNEPQSKQDSQLKSAESYFDNNYPNNPDLTNPLIRVDLALINMAKSGLYDASLNNAIRYGDKTTYDLRFLSDTGVLDDKATSLHITTDQYGMLNEENGHIPPGAWWLAPIGLLDHTLLANDSNGDRDGAILVGLFMLLLVAFPYIPVLNRLPEWLKVYKLIWRHKS